MRVSALRRRALCDLGVLMVPVFAALTASAGLILAGLAVQVGQRRGTAAGVSLAIVLVSVAWWGLAYGVELSVADLGAKLRWGDVKYVGVCALAPSWLVFVLQYTGRGRLVSKRLVGLLAVEPVAVLMVLAVPATHDLVRFYPDSTAREALPMVATGPIFWVNYVYANAMILIATVLFVATMVRLAGTYRRMAAALVAAALLPWVANALHNFEVGWFARLDLTPFVFTLTGATLAWGLQREGLVNLSPLARGVVVDTMADAVFVLDAFGHIAEANPSGAELLGTTRRRLLGLQLADLLPGIPRGVQTPVSRGELSVGEADDRRTFDLSWQPLSDRAGRRAGHLVVMRDITERTAAAARVHELLVERSRIAATLQASLVPGRLPTVPGAEIATRYLPARDGSEVGGDFYDVFPLAEGCWGVVLGDVSGKGAEAAALTGLTRYTLRTLANAKHPPSRTLAELNAHLLAATAEEVYCTLIYAQARPCAAGIELTVCLGGHHPPLLLRRNGKVEQVGVLGTVLGLLQSPELHDRTVTLAPEELICMFTDGLVEARRGSELFDTERAAAALVRCGTRSPEQIAEALVCAVRQFHGNELVDDLALLLLRAH